MIGVAYFTFFDPAGYQWTDEVEPPEGVEFEPWLLHWWAFRAACGCRQIEPITRAEYRRYARAAK